MQHGVQHHPRIQHLRQARIAGESTGQILDEAGVFVVAPKIERPIGEQRLGVHGGLLDARAVVVLDFQKQRRRCRSQAEGMDVVVFVDGYHHRVALANHLRQAGAGFLQFTTQAFAAERVYVLVLQLRVNIFPAQQGSGTRAHGVQPVSQRHRQHHGIAMDARAIGAGGLVEIAFCDGAWPAGIGSGLRTGNHEAEVRVVADICWRVGQQVDFRAGCRRATVQSVLGAADGVRQRRFHSAAAYSLATGFVVHLLQIGAIAQPPGLGQFVFGHAPDVFVVQKPRDIAPAPQRLGQLDAVRGAAGDALQFRRIRLAADGLRVQERGDDRLLRSPAWCQRRKLLLDLSRLGQLPFQESRPIRGLAVATGIHDVRQILHRFGNAPFARRGEQRGRANQRACIPRLCTAQGGGERTQNASRALKRRQLRPLAVEHVCEIRVKGKARQKPCFLGGAILGHGVVQLGKFSHYADDVRLVRILLAQRLAVEKAATQHLRNVFPRHRLHALFALPPNDCRKFVAYAAA